MGRSDLSLLICAGVSWSFRIAPDEPFRSWQCFYGPEALVGAQVNSCHDKTAGKGVPKTMPGEISNPGHANGGLEPMTRI
jgi:hypothetical protein